MSHGSPGGGGWDFRERLSGGRSSALGMGVRLLKDTCQGLHAKFVCRAINHIVSKKDIIRSTSHNISMRVKSNLDL